MPVPRHTHPRPLRKHGRDVIRFQRDRWISKRWRQSKRTHGDRSRLTGWRSFDPSSEEALGFAARTFQAPGARLFIHPEESRGAPESLGPAWPFYLPANRFARNPLNLCSCGLCRSENHGRRSRERRLWRHDVDEACEDR
jgi:hypothetical protein